MMHNKITEALCTEIHAKFWPKCCPPPFFCSKDIFCFSGYPNTEHRGSCDGPFYLEEKAWCQFGHGEEKKYLIAGMPKAVAHFMALSLCCCFPLPPHVRHGLRGLPPGCG
jgi:hypothetical protein